MCHVALNHSKVWRAQVSGEWDLHISQVPRVQIKSGSVRQQVSVLQGSLVASESAGVGMNRAAACCSLPYYTGPHGGILTTNCIAATSLQAGLLTLPPQTPWLLLHYWPRG